MLTVALTAKPQHFRKHNISDGRKDGMELTICYWTEPESPVVSCKFLFHV